MIMATWRGTSNAGVVLFGASASGIGLNLKR
jgi:hypothetical protein